MAPRTTPRWLQACSFLVHLYTASGTVLAFLIVLAAMRGNVLQALWLGLAALFIDGTDGWLARRFRVSETLPWFNGRRLDDIVDYLTYVFAPVLLLWTAGYLPAGPGGIVLAALPLLTSCYQFCRVDAKTEDYFFLGFPSYWNVVAFYTIVFKLAPITVGTILLICSILVFVPIRYLYPSRTVAFRTLTLTLTSLWMVMYAFILQQMPSPHPLLLNFSLFYLFYYVVLSLYLTYRAYHMKTR
ncbi:MAG TPA: CDP-diacylglycerol O-phosphatidyltransferase [Ktedonobacter sp.]|jgi:phosphatidylcholine synthase|nr:CDP-diacylglycerol O-phosphatidyltransferase [Ktedonobacter sp.]